MSKASAYGNLNVHRLNFHLPEVEGTHCDIKLCFCLTQKQKVLRQLASRAKWIGRQIKRHVDTSLQFDILTFEGLVKGIERLEPIRVAVDVVVVSIRCVKERLVSIKIVPNFFDGHWKYVDFKKNEFVEHRYTVHVRNELLFGWLHKWLVFGVNYNDDRVRLFNDFGSWARVQKLPRQHGVL